MTSPRLEPTQPRWLAIWSKPRAEKVALDLLSAGGIPAWLPTITVRRRWSDRWKDVEVPLFPGYLFAQTTPDAWPQLLRVRAVLTVVKQGIQPAWIREQYMDDLREAVKRIALGEEEPEVVEDFELGARVRVVDGPFSGLVGVVREKRGTRRLLVGVEQIGRALSIAIGAASVIRVAD